jgi:hypothetical protein
LYEPLKKICLHPKIKPPRNSMTGAALEGIISEISSSLSSIIVS